MSGLARTGQSLAVESVSAVQSNQWLSEAAREGVNSNIPRSQLHAEVPSVPVIRAIAANSGKYYNGNPYGLMDGLVKAPLRSVLVVLTGINMVSANSALGVGADRDLQGFARAFGGVTGFAAAFMSLQHKIAELNWREGLSRSINPEALSHGLELPRHLLLLLPQPSILLFLACRRLSLIAPEILIPPPLKLVWLVFLQDSWR